MPKGQYDRSKAKPRGAPAKTPAVKASAAKPSVASKSNGGHHPAGATQQHKAQPKTDPAIVTRGHPAAEAKDRADKVEKVTTLTKGSDTFTLYAVCVWVIQQLHIATPESILDFMTKNLKAKVSNIRILRQALEALRAGNILASVDNHQTDNGLARAYQIRKDSALPGFSVPDRASLVQIRDELDKSTFSKCIRTLMTQDSGKKAKAAYTPDVILQFAIQMETVQEILAGQPVAEHVMEKTSKAEGGGQVVANLRFDRVIRNGQLHVVIRPDHVRGWLRDNFREVGISDFFAKRCSTTPVFIPISNDSKLPGSRLTQKPIAGARMDRGMKVGTGITLYEALEPGVRFTLHLGIPQKAIGLPTAFIDRLILRSETCDWATGLGARAYGFGRMKVLDYEYVGSSMQTADIVAKLPSSPMVEKAKAFRAQFLADLAKGGAKKMGLAETVQTGQEGVNLPVSGDAVTNDDTAAAPAAADENED